MFLRTALKRSQRERLDTYVSQWQTDHAATECYARRVHHLRALQRARPTIKNSIFIDVTASAALCNPDSTNSLPLIDRWLSHGQHFPHIIFAALYSSASTPTGRKSNSAGISLGNLLLFSKREWNHVTSASIKKINKKKIIMFEFLINKIKKNK